jgi:adenylate cyclase class 2
MDLEIEVKFILSDYTALMSKIKALALPCTQERVFELNLRFDQPDRRLFSAHQVLRLRKDHQAHLTFKGPGVLEEGVLLRKEIETIVADYDATKRLLETIGYEVIMIYEKYRANYLMNGVVLSVDETPFGLFIELEGESPEQVRLAADKLGMDWAQRINQSYFALLNAFNQNTGNNFRDLSFENFRGLKVEPSDLNLSYADLK